jgi:hypothetical protein
MEPPICSLCDRDQRDFPDLEFELVKFADYESIDHPGHPDGLLWFCADHLEGVKRLTDLDSGEALRRLRSEASRPAWLRALRWLFVKGQ